MCTILTYLPTLGLVPVPGSCIDPLLFSFVSNLISHVAQAGSAGVQLKLSSLSLAWAHSVRAAWTLSSCTKKNYKATGVVNSVSRTLLPEGSLSIWNNSSTKFSNAY